jgi:octanoyl-[GcvH]:protein N-octanoyltransferase
VVVVDGAPRVRAVLEDVYDALGLEWDPASVGSIAAELPGITVAQVQAALLAPIAGRYRLVPSGIEDAERAAAHEQLGRHHVSGS